MVEKRTATPSPAKIIGDYLDEPQDEDRLGMWEKRNFVATFPQITKGIIKEEIPLSQERIAAVFHSGMSALNTLHWSFRNSPKGFTPLMDFVLDENGIVSGLGSQSGTNGQETPRESLSTANLACLLLLGMKAMNDEPLKEDMEKYDALLAKPNLSRIIVSLLEKTNAVRKWIIKDKLEPAWDARLSKLLLGIHEDRTASNDFAVFPPLLSKRNAFEAYSQVTIFLHLEYIEKILRERKLRILGGSKRQLDDFFGFTLANMPEKFRKDDRVLKLVESINKNAKTNYQI